MGAAPQEGRESHLTCSGAHGCVVPTGHPGRKAPGSQAAGLGQAGEETGGGEAGAGYTEGRSPPRVTQDRCHAGQVTPNLGLQPCLFVFQEGTTHKQCVSGTKGSSRGGARPNPGFLITGQGSGDLQLGCCVSSGQLSQQLGGGGGRRSQ